MQVSANGAFIYFTIPIFGGIPITQTVVSSLIVTIVLCLGFILCGRNLQKRPGTRQVLVEKAVGMLQNLVKETMGEHNLHWTPFIGTIFLSCMCGSYIGLTGFLRSTTADISCVAVWAIMVSVIIWYQNIKHNGFLGWLKGFTEPIAVMTPINLVSEVAQPLSMAFRQFGNMTGGGILTSILYTALSMASAALLNFIAGIGWLAAGILVAVGVLLLVLHFRKKHLAKLIFGSFSTALGICGILQITGILPGIPILAYGIPAVLSCYFDLFSGFIQAFVFTLLSMVYIGGALPGPEEAPAQ